MRCEYDDPFHGETCTDEAVCRISWGPQWTGNQRIDFDDPSFACLGHAIVSYAGGRNSVTMLDGSEFPKPLPSLAGVDFGHCEDGHGPVGWRGADPCFVCFGAPVDGSIYDLSHTAYYGPGEPAVRWRVLEEVGGRDGRFHRTASRQIPPIA